MTKQQEILVGVGVLALLGYFAFRTPEKPLETAPGHSRPTEPSIPLKAITIKQDPDIVKKAKAFDNMRDQAQFVSQQVNAFQTQFNRYCAVRQQARASFMERNNSIQGTTTRLFPLADFMRRDIENLIKLAREIQLSYESGLRTLNLTREQFELCRNVFEVVIPTDLRNYERFLHEDLEAEMDLMAAELVSWTQVQNNNLIQIANVYPNTPGQETDYKMKDVEDPKNSALIGRQQTPSVAASRVSQRKRASDPPNMNSVSSVASQGTHNTGATAAERAQEAFIMRNLELLEDARGNRAGIQDGFEPPPPNSLQTGEFYHGGSRLETPAQRPSISAVNQTTILSDSAFNQANGQSVQLSTHAQSAQDGILDLTGNNGAPAPQKGIARVPMEASDLPRSSRSRSSESDASSASSNVPIAQGFAQVSSHPSVVSHQSLPGARSASIPLRSLPATAATDEAIGDKRPADTFESTKQQSTSLETIEELDRKSGLTGDSEGKFDSAPANVKSKPRPKSSEIAAGREEVIDSVYAKRMNDVFGQANHLIQNFPVDPLNLTASRAATERLFRIYEDMLRIFPQDDSPDYGYLTVVKEYPYVTNPPWKLNGKIQIPSNYFLWAINDKTGGKSGKYETKKVNTDRFTAEAFNKATGKGAALFDFILATPEFQLYKEKVNNIYKQLKVIIAKYMGGVPDDWR